MRVLVLGAGFGGLELTTRLSDELGDDVEVVLLDRAEGFVFGFSKLDVMFGRTLPAAVRHPYRDLVKPGVTFVSASVDAIDAAAKRVETSAGTFDADVLVIGNKGMQRRVLGSVPKSVAHNADCSVFVVKTT